jgi:YVTN family beta-propeller protein
MPKNFLLTLIVTSMLMSACAMALTPSPAPTNTVPPTTAPTATVAATAVSAPTPTSAPTAVPPTSTSVVAPAIKYRVFVACELPQTVEAWEGLPAKKIGEVKTGEYPHNISASNNGKYIATALRHDGTIAVIDAAAVKEIARIPVGVSPHDMAWSPDDKTLYVTHEYVSYFSVIDTQTWKLVKHVDLKFGQHDIAISPDGSELWITTTSYRGILILDRATLKVKKEVFGFPHGSHDFTFIPERNEVFITSSGLIQNSSQVDPFVLVFDTKAYKLIDSKPMGFYPFHSVKKFRDGYFLEPNLPTFWLSDRGFGGVIEVDIAKREVITQIKTGKAPFHMSAGPGGLIYVANNEDSTVSAVDTKRKIVADTLKVGKNPHGVVVVPAP